MREKFTKVYEIDSKEHLQMLSRNQEELREIQNKLKELINKLEDKHGN